MTTLHVQPGRAATYDPWQHLLGRLQPILAAKPCARVYEPALWT